MDGNNFPYSSNKIKVFEYRITDIEVMSLIRITLNNEVIINGQ